MREIHRLRLHQSNSICLYEISPVFFDSHIISICWKTERSIQYKLRMHLTSTFGSVDINTVHSENFDSLLYWTLSRALVALRRRIPWTTFLKIRYESFEWKLPESKIDRVTLWKASNQQNQPSAVHYTKKSKSIQFQK